jgi:hypothetical protein
MFSEQVTFRDAVIDSIHCKTQDGKVQSRILAHVSLSQEAAEVLGVKSLVFAENGTPKEGFHSLALDTGCAAFRALFEHPELKQSFEIATGDSTDSYVVQRMEEGRLKLKLRLNYHGDPHPAIAFINSVGNAESRLKIIPLQGELSAEEDEDEHRPRKNHEYPPEEQKLMSADAVRQRMITHRGSGKQASGAR